MKKNLKSPNSQSGIFRPRALLAFAFCSIALFLTALGFATTSTPAGWSLISSPNPSPTSSWVSSVACASANDCWAIGGGNITLHWNVISWAAVATPNLSSATCA